MDQPLIRQIGEPIRFGRRDFKDFVRSCLWAWVAACAAWRLYPREATVVDNESLEQLRKDYFQLLRERK